MYTLPMQDHLSQPIALGLGSNLGARAAHLAAARAALLPQVILTKESSLYETAAWGYTDQPAFLNQAILGQTNLTPLELLAHLKNIEHELGRQASFRYGPREIDLDILYYANQNFEFPELTIPHPQLFRRAFVLVPLAEIMTPDINPAFAARVIAALADLDTSGIRKWQPAP